MNIFTTTVTMNYFNQFFRKTILIVLLLGGMIFSGTSQSLELGAIIGSSAYKGDLASSELAVIQKQSNSAIGGFLRYNFNDQFSLKLQALSTDLEADDANSNYELRRQRNLRFFTPLLDVSLRVEWHPLETIFQTEGVISPYIAAGGSFFTFNPQAKYQGKIYELQPLATEGQGSQAYPDRKRYKLYNFSALLGVGVAFKVSDDFKIAVEVIGHHAFTDYIDDVGSTYANYYTLLENTGEIAANIAYQFDDYQKDVAQFSPIADTPRGNDSINDFYLIGGVTLSYSLFNSYEGNGRGGAGCPIF